MFFLQKKAPFIGTLDFFCKGLIHIRPARGV